MSDTPRTDAEDRWQVDKDELGLTCRETVRIDFARELERECAALRAALRELINCEVIQKTARAAGTHDRERADLIVEYYRRAPLAWIAARALLEE